MQFDLFFFYTFTGALSLAAQHVLSQEEGFGLPGDNEAATLLFCIALSTAAWSGIGVLGSLCTDKKEEEDLDDYLHIPGGGTIRRPNRLDTSELIIEKPDKPSPTASDSSGYTTDPDYSGDDSELDKDDVPKKMN
jgi:hypothetical protein